MNKSGLLTLSAIRAGNLIMSADRFVDQTRESLVDESNIDYRTDRQAGEMNPYLNISAPDFPCKTLLGPGRQ